MPYVNGKYYSDSELRAIKKQLNNDDDSFEKFLISGVIGAAVGSTLVGGLLGGSFTGGFIGDLLEGTDDSWL